MSVPTTVGWRQPTMHTPAYSSVPARQTLMRPAQPEVQAPPASNPPARKVEWPAPVRAYVRRSFEPEYEVLGISKEEMQEKLKEIITDAATKDMLNEIDWPNHPLPQHYIQEERKAVALNASRLTWPQNVISPYMNTLNGDTNSPASSTSSASQKRKPHDEPLAEQTDEALPPWRRKANNRNPFEDRITYANQEQAERAGKRQRKAEKFMEQTGTSKFSQADLDKRKQRFQTGRPADQQTPPWSSRVNAPPDVDNGPVVGTCQDLEKKYFRLTAPPKPETVRPQPILEKTLDFLKRKWRKESNYGYTCDQFKSLRQDLTVQHIKNNFTVSVYEIHARIALEKGDLGEYNQCQTQLRALYSQKIGGRPDEFLAYRILYFIYTCNRSDMNDVLAELTPADKKESAVAHALGVRSALALGNYHKFFQLYLAAPNMGAYLMDMFIERERLAALANICRAYKPDVSARFLTEELGFESDSDCLEFLCAHNAQHLLQQTEDGVRVLAGKAGGLFDNLRAAAFSKVDIKGQI